MERQQQENQGARSGSTFEPPQQNLSSNAELLSLAADSLALAQEVDSFNEKFRLVRAAIALTQAAIAGEIDNAGAWQQIGDVAARVVARLPR